MLAGSTDNGKYFLISDVYPHIESPPMKKTLLLACFFHLCYSSTRAQTLITTICGIGGTAGYTGDGTLATDATLHTPGGIFVNAAGDVYIADGLYNYAVRKVTAATGIITTIAGTGIGATTGDGGPATAAAVNWPNDIYVHSSGDVYITESSGKVIRRISAATGNISTIAGTGANAYTGDGGPATAAALEVPTSVTGDAVGNIYFTEYGSSTVRKISAATGIITTVAGTGVTGTSADGGPAVSTKLNGPDGLYIASNGDIYIADAASHRIRKVSAATGIISTVAGNGTNGYSGDGGPATDAQLFNPSDVSIDAGGNMYIADVSNHVIRKVSAAGIITTIAGDGTSGFTGDGGPATAARLYGPGSVFAHPSGAIYISDGGNDVIRKIETSTAGIAKQETVTGIYPNPARTELYVPGIHQATTYRILDVTGNCLQHGLLQNTDNTIHLRNVATGTYLLQLTGKDNGTAVMQTITVKTNEFPQNR